MRQNKRLSGWVKKYNNRTVRVGLKKKKSVINNPLTHSVIYPNQMAKYLKAKKKKKKKKA